MPAVMPHFGRQNLFIFMELLRERPSDEQCYVGPKSERRILRWARLVSMGKTAAFSSSVVTKLGDQADQSFGACLSGGRGFIVAGGWNFFRAPCVTLVAPPAAQEKGDEGLERISMRTTRQAFLGLAVCLALLLAATSAFAATATRYLHVRVSNLSTHELVRINIPLILAEKVIPSINRGQLRDGKVQIHNFSLDSINVRAILDALKTAPEGEFVTVQDNGSDVRVAKAHGQMMVHVIENNDDIEVTIPWEVTQALISDGNENQLNIEAAVKALENVGDTTLLRVSGHDNVRVWVDSRNTDE
jgi:hypothetical protein